MYTMTEALIEFIVDMDNTKRENKFLSKFFMREKIKFFKRRLKAYMYRPEYSINDLTRICQFVSTAEKHNLYKSDEVVQVKFDTHVDKVNGIVLHISEMIVSVIEANSSIVFNYRTHKYVHKSFEYWYETYDKDMLSIGITTRGPVMEDFTEIYKTADKVRSIIDQKVVHSVKNIKTPNDVIMDSACDILSNAIVIIIEEIVSNLKERYLT